MNKRIRSVMLCLAMLAVLFFNTATAFADTAVIMITADKTEVQPGDTVDFSIVLGPVSDMGTMQMIIVIPEGLTYVEGSGKLADGLKSTLGFDYADFTEASMMVNGVASKDDYSSYDNTLLCTFQCTADENYEGTAEVGLRKLEFYSCKTWKDHTSEYSVANAVIKVGGEETPAEPETPGGGESGEPSQPGGNTEPETPGSGESGEPSQPGGNTDPEVPGSGESGESSQPGGNTEPETPGSGEIGEPSQPGGNTEPETPGSGESGEPSQPGGNTEPETPSGDDSEKTTDTAPTDTGSVPENNEKSPETDGSWDSGDSKGGFPWWAAVAAAIIALSALLIILKRRKRKERVIKTDL